MNVLVKICCLGIFGISCLVQGSVGTMQLVDVAFHNHYRGQSWGYEGSVTQDNGGTVFILVKNNDFFSREAVIEQIKINDMPIEDMDLDYYRIWPPVAGQGRYSVVTAKAIGAPLQENSSIDVEVTTGAGQTLTGQYTLTTPKLRLGSVELSQDRKTVYIFVRNLDTLPYTLNTVYMNRNVTNPATFVGTPDVVPNGVNIIKVPFNQPLTLLDQYVIRIGATRQDGQSVTTSAVIRLTESQFPICNWSTAVGQDVPVQQFFRTLQGNSHHGAPGDGQMAINYNNYFIRGMVKAHSGTTIDAARVTDNIGQQRLHAWLVAEEPKGPVHVSNEVNQQYWQLDPTHPTYILLDSMRTYNRYGHIPDIISMDHYVYGNHPSIIGSCSNRQMSQAFDYTDALKRNTEPTRMWAWSQLSLGGWPAQPAPWSVDYQFWSHIMGGAKGIQWFRQGGDYEDYMPAMAVAQRCGRMLNQVRNLILYSDVSDRVTPSSDDVITRALVGEHAAVIVVVNDKTSRSCNGWFWQRYPTYTIASNSGTISYEVPEWIPLDQVYQVTDDGSVTPAYSISERTVTISFDFESGSQSTEQARVYVIGKHDTTGPEAPGPVITAEVVSSTERVLSWQEVTDNFGVMGYKLYRDGFKIADLREPIYRDTNADDDSVYTVRAYDAAGNLSTAPEADKVLEWKLDGNAEDTSGNSNHGTLHNFPSDGSQWVGGLNGRALKFNGIDNMVRRSSTLTGVPLKAEAAWSLNFYVKIADPVNLTAIAGFGDHTNVPEPGGQVRYISNVDGMYFWGAWADVPTQIPYDVDKWQMITAVYHRGFLSLYRNAQLVASAALSFDDAREVVALSPPSPWGNYFRGIIDEFTLWDGALNANQMQTLLDLLPGRFQGDLDGDGKITLADLLILAGDWLSTDCDVLSNIAGNQEDDCIVDMEDFNVLAEHYGM